MTGTYDRGRGQGFSGGAGRGGASRGLGGDTRPRVPTGGTATGRRDGRPEGWPSTQEVQRIIGENDPQHLVQYAETVGQHLAHTLSSSQVRNVFATARAVEQRWPDPMAEHDLLRLKPLLAYQVGRASGSAKRALQDLESVLVPAVERVGAPGRQAANDEFRRFVDFFEAILAYHKRHGGK